MSAKAWGKPDDNASHAGQTSHSHCQLCLRSSRGIECLLWSAEEDKQVLDACEEWLRQAETLVDEADAKIEAIMRPDGGSLLAEEWVTFVHKYSMQIKDIEQVSGLGNISSWLACTP